MAGLQRRLWPVISVLCEKGSPLMANRVNENTWQENPDDIILLVNHTRNNYILELPAGRCRLDAGRSLRTLRSICNIKQVQELLEQGSLVIEH